MEKYETFSTTADVGIRVTGRDHEELIHNAVNGLNQLLFGYQLLHQSNIPYHFEYEGDSIENILVNLLSEILFLLQIQNKQTTGLIINEISETYINVDILTSPSKRVPEVEIKSVTYHNLKIIQTNDTLKTEIIFDI